MNETRKSILDLVYMAFYIALAIVLSYLNTVVPIIKMPQGGSLELYVVALFMASYHLGWKKGVITSALTFVLMCLLGMCQYLVSPLQVLLDYIFPIAFMGVASCFPKIRFKNFTLSNVYVGIFGCMFVKYASQVLSGVYLWVEGEAAGSWAAWVYSAWTYNLGYNLVTLIAALILTPLLIKAVKRLRGVTFIGIKE